jgi:hypothetical protein
MEDPYRTPDMHIALEEKDAEIAKKDERIKELKQKLKNQHPVTKLVNWVKKNIGNIAFCFLVGFALVSIFGVLWYDCSNYVSLEDCEGHFDTLGIQCEDDIRSPRMNDSCRCTAEGLPVVLDFNN